MPQPVPPPGMFEMQQYNIPTHVEAPVRQAPHMNLSFPVFTPPAASSYGSTQPMRVPWTPPDLAGALNAGLETGGKLATEFMQNRKTAQEVQAEEQAQRAALAAMSDPNRRAQMGFEMGPGGFTARLPSPLDIYTKQAELAKTGAETAEARERTRVIGPESESKIAQEKARTEQEKVQTRLLGVNQAQRILSGATSGFITDQGDQTNPSTAGTYTGTDENLP